MEQLQASLPFGFKAACDEAIIGIDGRNSAAPRVGLRSARVRHRAGVGPRRRRDRRRRGGGVARVCTAGGLALDHTFVDFRLLSAAPPSLTVATTRPPG